MRTFIGTIVSALILAPSLFAQVPTSGNIFIGYSYNRATATIDNATNLNGWNGSLEGKIFPFVGLVADFSGYYGSASVPASCPAIIGGGPCLTNLDMSEHNFLFGPRVSFSAGRFRPFAHVLRIAHQRQRFWLGHIVRFRLRRGTRLPGEGSASLAIPSRLLANALFQSNAKRFPLLDRHRVSLLRVRHGALADQRRGAFSYSKHDRRTILRLEALQSHAKRRMTSGPSKRSDGDPERF